jgi:hypothetical protein
MQAKGAERRPGVRALRAAGIALALLGLFALLIPQQFADPFARHDDWPAVLAEPGLYWWKTLAKGRWLTWAWTARPWPAGPVPIWWLYMALWCASASFVAVGLFRRERWPLGAALFALAIVMMPQTADISAWFAATLPATAMLALQAGIACLGTARHALGGLAVTVPLALMSHSSYPLMLLLATALAADWRGVRHAWAVLPAVFLGSLALGVALIHALNRAVHGHFGIDTSRWLDERPAGDLAGLLANAAYAVDWLRQALWAMAVGSGAGAAALLALAGVAAALLLARGSRQAGVLLAAGALALALSLAPALLRGIETPARATGFLWLLPAGLYALALRDLERPARRAAFGAALVLAAGIGAQLWSELYGRILPPYQAMTREIAGRIAAAGQADTVLVAGQVHGLPRAAELRFASGFPFRMRHLTGARVHLCDPQTEDLVKAVGEAADTGAAAEYAAYRARWSERRAACARHAEALARLPAWPAEGHVERIAPGVVGLRLPERRLADAPP